MFVCVCYAGVYTECMSSAGFPVEADSGYNVCEGRGCGIGKGRARSIHDVIPKLAQSKKVGVIVFVQMLFVYLPMAGGCLVRRVCCLFLRTRAARIAETFNVKNMGMNVNIRRILLSVIFVVSAAVAAAQDWGRLPIPKADRELIYNVVKIMNMPEGTHRIYNGKGSTIFDVVYTIRCRKGEWVVYNGGMESVFDALYTVTADGKGTYTIYKGGMKSVFDILYRLEYTDRGMKLYKGDSFSVNPIYTYERD